MKNRRGRNRIEIKKKTEPEACTKTVSLKQIYHLFGVLKVYWYLFPRMQRVRTSSQAQAGNSDEPQPANSIKEKRRRMKGKQVCFVLVFASGKNKSEGAFLYSREDVIAFVLNLKIQYILINSYNNQINLMNWFHNWIQTKRE